MHGTVSQYDASSGPVYTETGGSLECVGLTEGASHSSRLALFLAPKSRTQDGPQVRLVGSFPTKCDPYMPDCSHDGNDSFAASTAITFDQAQDTQDKTACQGCLETEGPYHPPSISPDRAALLEEKRSMPAPQVGGTMNTREAGDAGQATHTVAENTPLPHTCCEYVGVKFVVVPKWENGSVPPWELLA